MASGGKTTLCDYSMLFSSVIYLEKTARLDFGQKIVSIIGRIRRKQGELDEPAMAIEYPPSFPVLSSFLFPPTTPYY